MAISVFKTWSSGDILTAADLNSSFAQFANNGTDAAFPLTKTVGAGGFVVTNLGLGVAATDAASLQNIHNLAPLHTCEFRLTLTSVTPVTTSDVTGAATIYASPYTGNKIALYDGTNWNVRSSAEFSIALGTLTSGLPYDVFCYDSGGTPTLEVLAWTNTTTRATALALQNGVLSKTGALTRRYLGTFYTTSTTTTEDSAAKRFVWNYYNRVRRAMRVTEATGSWNYTTATIRQANGSSANQLAFVMGYGEDCLSAELYALVSNTNAAVSVEVGIGLDSTTSFASGGLGQGGNRSTPAALSFLTITSSAKVYPGVGYHFLSWNEYSSAVGTTTWYGSSNFGIHGEIWS